MYQPFRRGKKYTMLAAMNCHGIIAYKIIEGAATGDIFISFIQDLIVPAMQAYPGRNSIVIADGARIHTGRNIAPIVSATLANNGGQLVFLPPYSPDYNPIELVFGWIKKWLRLHPDISEQYPEISMINALRSIPSEMFRKWITHCNYNNQ